MVDSDSAHWGERTAADLASLLVELSRALKALGFYSDGGLAHVEYFDVGDLDAALTLFDELDAASGVEASEGSHSEGTAADITPITQDMTALVSLLDEAVSSRNWDLYSSLLSPDFTHRDHRSGSGASNGDADAVESERNASALFGHLNATKIVAERAGRFVVRRGDYGPTGARVMAFVSVTEFDDTGLVARTHTFDADHIDDAMSVLDEWCAE
jgi:hypothetical protein